MRTLLLAIALVLVPATPRAQSGGTFRINQALIANGGGVATGATLRLDGTIALVCAGPVPSGQMTGGAYRLRGGFWPEDDAATGDALFADGFE
jgi:hypothetical protein